MGDVYEIALVKKYPDCTRRLFTANHEIIATGVADFVALSRPLIRQPELPNLWLTGAGKNTAECISCNGCLPLTEPLTCRGKKVA